MHPILAVLYALLICFHMVLFVVNFILALNDNYTDGQRVAYGFLTIVWLGILVLDFVVLALR